MEAKHEMPMGFVFQLSLNEKAMHNFAKMTEEEKKQVLETARSVTSKEQMKSIVSDLSELNQGKCDRLEHIKKAIKQDTKFDSFFYVSVLYIKQNIFSKIEAQQ